MIQRPHRKVRFVKVEIKALPRGRCRAFVDLVRITGDVYVGSAEGKDSTRLEVVAAATVDAIRQIVEGPEEMLVVRAVSTVPVHGTRAVVVSASVSYENQTGSVQGLCVINDDPNKAAVLAVLSATNRYFGIG